MKDGSVTWLQTCTRPSSSMEGWRSLLDFAASLWETAEGKEGKTHLCCLLTAPSASHLEKQTLSIGQHPGMNPAQGCLAGQAFTCI